MSDVGIFEIPQQLPTGAATAANQVLEIADLDAIAAKDFATQTTLAALNGKVTAVDTGAVVVASSALPSGASTSVLQGTGNTSLSSIDGKLGTLGQKAMTGSAPVVIASDQSAIPVSGTVTVGTISTVTTITNPVGVKGADGSAISSNANPLPISDAGGSITVDGTVAATQSGTWNIGTVTSVTAIAGALPAGSAIIGKTGIDQTTPGTTNKVSIGTDGTVAINTALPAGSNVIGHIIADTGSTTAVTGNVAVTNAGLTNIDVLLSTRTKPADQQHTIIDSGTTVVTQPTGTNLHTVIDSGVITTVGAVTSITNALPAGTAVIGKVGIDQTTPGTTNAVAIISGQNGVAGGDGNVDATTQRAVIAANVISSVNSSTVTLAANAVFTGTSEEIISYSEARVTIYSDVASATDGLSIQQSTDNINWVITDTYSVAATTGKTFAVPRQARYFRVIYTNGGAAQSTFILQSTYTRVGGSVSSQRPSDNYTNETDLEQMQAFTMNYNPSTGTWYRIRGDATNGLYVNPQGINVEYQRRVQEEILERTKIQMLNLSQASGGGNYQFEYR